MFKAGDELLKRQASKIECSDARFAIDVAIEVFQNSGTNRKCFLELPDSYFETSDMEEGMVHG